MAWNFNPFTLAGGLVDSVSNIFTQQMNRNFQREMWQEHKAYNTSERLAAQEYQTGERLETQEYNSPQQQMARLMAAGINPNSAAGMVEGVQSQPMSSSGATASPSFTDLVNPLDLASVMQMAAQTKLTTAQAKAQETQNKYLDEQSQLSIEQQKRAIDLAKSTTAYQDAQKNWTDTQRKQAEELFPILVQKSQSELEQIKQQCNNLVQQSELIKSQKRKTDEEVNLTQAETSVALQQHSNMQKQGQVLDYDIKQSEFEQSFRDIGIDPKGNLGISLLKMLSEDPSQFSSIISNVIDSLGTAVKSLFKRGTNPEGEKPFWHRFWEPIFDFNPFN